MFNVIFHTRTVSDWDNSVVFGTYSVSGFLCLKSAENFAALRALEDSRYPNTTVEYQILN